MASTMDDFVWYAPRNHFYFAPTGTRWVKKGVEAAIGSHGVQAVIEKHMAIDKKELIRLLSLKGGVPESEIERNLKWR